MKSSKRLQIEQLDRKMAAHFAFPDPPPKGWINGIRTAMNMSLRQLGGRLGITTQSAQEIEARESNGSITLKSLRDVGASMNMKLIYGFVPRDGSFDQMLAMQALKVAREIVRRTDTTMNLEGQQVTKERMEKAVQELADEIKREMPRFLWD